jgi:hypothetical protein
MVSCVWQYEHFSALGWTLLRHEGHSAFSPAMNEAASPNGPKRKPKTNHKDPFAPRLEATRVAPMPQKIQTIKANIK